jgi:hypothetical protein
VSAFAFRVVNFTYHFSDFLFSAQRSIANYGSDPHQQLFVEFGGCCPYDMVVLASIEMQVVTDVAFAVQMTGIPRPIAKPASK